MVDRSRWVAGIALVLLSSIAAFAVSLLRTEQQPPAEAALAGDVPSAPAEVVTVEDASPVRAELAGSEPPPRREMTAREPIRLERLITGIVVRAEDDRPVPDVPVTCRWTDGGSRASCSADTRKDGRFRMNLPGQHETVLLTAFHEEWGWARKEDVPADARGVELLLRRHPIDVLVRERFGGVVESYAACTLNLGDRRDGYVEPEVEPSTIRSGLSYRMSSGRMTFESHPGGRVTLSVPDGPFAVVVWAEGYQPVWRGAFLPEMAPRTIEFELEPRAGVGEGPERRRARPRRARRPL